MAKVHWREVPAKERLRMVKEMARLFQSVGNERDMVQLLYRLFTSSEIVMIGRRMQIAELLVNGWSYQSIQEKLHVGVATIRSADRWLEHALRDYMRIRKEQKARERRQRKAREFRETYQEWSEFGSFDHIRRQYSLPFMLVNLLLDPPVIHKKKSKNKRKKPKKK